MVMSASLPFLASAEFVTSTILVDGESIEYTALVESDIDNNGLLDSLVYYLGDDVVLRTYDMSGDSVADVWFVYGDDEMIRREIIDTDADGAFDIILTLDEEMGVLDLERITADLDVVDLEEGCDCEDNETYFFDNTKPTMSWILVGILVILTIIVLWRVRG